MSKSRFEVSPYKRWDKKIEVCGPEGLVLSVDFDDVDQARVEAALKQMVGILNSGWPRAEETHEDQPTMVVLFRRAEIMPDGSLGAVFIGEAGGDRSKDLRLTQAQALQLAAQITAKVKVAG